MLRNQKNNLPKFDKLIQDQFKFRIGNGSTIYSNNYHKIVVDGQRFEESQVVTEFLYEGNRINVVKKTDLEVNFRINELFFS